MRQYTATDALIVHGYAHQPILSWKPPPAGGLFHKCIVCPTFKNLPPLWERDPDSWAIFYSWVHDGNFSGQHTVSRQAGNNVPLYPGTGAFQDPAEVKAALKDAKTDQTLEEEDPQLVSQSLNVHFLGLTQQCSL